MLKISILHFYTIIWKILSGITYIFYLCVCTYVSICVLCSHEISSHFTILWGLHRCMPMNKCRGHGKVLCVCTKLFEWQSFSCKGPCGLFHFLGQPSPLYDQLTLMLTIPLDLTQTRRKGTSIALMDSHFGIFHHRVWTLKNPTIE